MPLSTTYKAAYQQYKSSLLLPLRRKKHYDKGTQIISLIVMSAPRTDKIILIFCEYKNHSKENTSTIMSMWHLILNHSQENFVMEIKHISWSCPDPIFFKNKYPNPILIQKNCKYPAGYPILILSMLTSDVYLTTMTVLLMWQTQRFILTVSLPADL